MPTGILVCRKTARTINRAELHRSVTRINLIHQSRLYDALVFHQPRCCMSTFLTLKQLQNFKNELLELRRQLRLELQAEVIGRTVNEAAPNLISQDDSREFILAVHNELEACEAALYRLEQGCFGLCVSCGEEIELSRLIASPVTSCCLRCQSFTKVV